MISNLVAIHKLVSFLILPLTILGCTHVSYQGLKAISPEVAQEHLPSYNTVVESLQPKLTWSPSKEANATYDLAILSTNETFLNGTTGDKVVYQREGLSSSSHKVEVPLTPNSIYIWKVRERNGNMLSDWSKYSYFLFGGYFFSSIGDLSYSFKTPNP